MFDHVVLRRAKEGLPISAGHLAEALLYYQKIQLFLDRGTLFHLVKQIGTSSILALLRRPEVSAVYCEENLGTRTDLAGVSQYHNYVAFTISGHQDIGPLKTPVERLSYELARQGVTKKEARKFSEAFLDLVPIRRLSGDHFLPGGIPTAAKRDLLDIDYAKEALRHAVAATPGGYALADDLELKIINSELGCFVFTNIDLEAINHRRTQANPPIEPLTIAHLLSEMLEARADLALSSFYGGDFVTSEVISSIIRARHAEFLRRSNLNAASREQFTEVVLPDVPSLAEVVDSGERSFDEFLLLLDKAARFKDWLRAVNPDEGLVRSYMRDISSEGWIQRLPAKTIRYVIASALDATHPGASLVTSFTDNFLVEKMLSGWRPNHFITRRLGPFVQGH